MGGESFMNTIEARTAREGFDTLVAQAQKRFGDNPYNGTISTCGMGKCVKKLSADEGDERVYELITEVYDYGQKWVADYIEIEPKDPRKFSRFVFFGIASC